MGEVEGNAARAEVDVSVEGGKEGCGQESEKTCVQFLVNQRNFREMRGRGYLQGPFHGRSYQ